MLLGVLKLNRILKNCNKKRENQVKTQIGFKFSAKNDYH